MSLGLRIDLVQIKCEENSTEGWANGLSAIVGSRMGDGLMEIVSRKSTAENGCATKI